MTLHKHEIPAGDIGKMHVIVDSKGATTQQRVRDKYVYLDAGCKIYPDKGDT